MQEYVKWPEVDCQPKLHTFSSLLDALNACSGDIDCGGVSQSCLQKGQAEQQKQNFFTCGYPPNTKLVYNDHCRTIALYQKSKKILI